MDNTMEMPQETQTSTSTTSDMVIAALIGAVFTATVIYGGKAISKVFVNVRDRRRNKTAVVEDIKPEPKK